jgi:two-component system chemotaxis response regulator CheB
MSESLSSVSVLVADDAAVIRKAIRGLLEDEPSINILCEADSFDKAILLATSQKPDVILLDLHMPDSDALDPVSLTRGLSNCGSRILAMTLLSEDEEEDRRLAKELGAVILLDKSNLGQELIPAILNHAHR